MDEEQNTKEVSKWQRKLGNPTCYTVHGHQVHGEKTDMHLLFLPNCHSETGLFFLGMYQITKIQWKSSLQLMLTKAMHIKKIKHEIKNVLTCFRVWIC